MVRFYTYLEIYLEDLSKKASLGDFENYFKKPHQTIKQHLQEFVDEKILIMDMRARFIFYSLNKKNPLLMDYLSMCEKERLFAFLRSNSLFKRMHEILAKRLHKNKVVIFGSAASQKDFADIDLLIISDDKKIRKDLNKFMKTYDIKLHIVQALEKHLEESFINEIKKKHIMLNGHDYLVKLIYKNELGMV